MSEENRELLKVENLAVSLGEKEILKNISFSVTPGEFIGIIGPNGAGKSTLLRSIRGLSPISAGKITVFLKKVQDFGEKEFARYIAYMQQEVCVNFGFTALQIVLTGRYPYLSWWKNEGKEDYEIAKKNMSFTGVLALANTSIQEVSGGERQRILLAKVLAQETPVVFLDEPTASLDLLYQEEIFRYCQVICQQGKTVLLVAHDLKLAAKFCSRMILLANGSIIADGKAEDVITAENLETAYGLHSAVFLNKVTGNLDIHTYAACSSIQKRQVHIIGGGGAAGEIIRFSHEKSYCISSGVLQEGDTDTDVAKAFSVDCITIPPFSSIDKQSSQKNCDKIEQADFVILTDICIGQDNIENLKNCFSAKKLIIIDDRSIQERDYTGGEAASIYIRLCQLPQTCLMSSKVLLEKLSSGNL